MMGAKTGISWTDSTWGPIRGCSRVSAGCQSCYAERIAARFGGTDPRTGKQMPYAGLTDRHGRWNGRVSLVEEHLTDPLRWKKPRRIFVNSMSDLFHENVRDEWIDQIFAVMALASQHKFQVLTKRPERMRDYMASPETPKRVDYVRHVILAGNLASLWTPERTMAIADWPGYHITSHA